jgi:hypothetical protein
VREYALLLLARLGQEEGGIVLIRTDLPNPLPENMRHIRKSVVDRNKCFKAEYICSAVEVFY